MIKLKKPLIFLHIPKTGGTTFNFILKDVCQRNNLKYLRDGDHGKVSSFSFDKFKSKKENNIYSAHYVFSDECKNVDLFCLVRNIYNNFFSNLYYQYFRSLEKNYNIDNLKHIKNKINLNLNLNLNDVEVIRNLINNNFLTSNIITKTIAGIQYEKFYFIVKDYKITNKDFRKAVKNLKFFKIISDISNFKLFLKEFINLYNFNSISYINQNIASYDRKFVDSLTKELYSEISKYNNYDLLLLSEIKKRFSVFF